MRGIADWFLRYLATTPADQVGFDILIYFGWYPIFGVLVWGFVQIWLDAKQKQYSESLKWDLLVVSIPQDAIQTPKGMTNFFNNLSGSKSAITWKEKWFFGKTQAHFSFEIVSNGGQIMYYIRTINKYRDLVEASVYAQYPDAQIVEVEDYIDQIPSDYPHEEYDLFGTEMKLSNPEIFPIKRYEDFEHVGEKDLRFKDPILPLLEMMGKMRPGEHFWIQILIKGPDSQDWRKKAVKWMKTMYGIEEKKKSGLIESSIGWIPAGILEQVAGMQLGASGDKEDDAFRMWKLTPDEQDTLKAVNVKSKEIGWTSKIRVVYCAKKELFRKGTMASMIKGIFLQFDSGMNKLGMTDNVTTKDDYFWMLWQMPGRQRKLTKNYKKRSFDGTTPYVLSASELATIWHFPPADARTPVLTSLGARMAEAPQELGFALDEGIILPNMERSAPDSEGSSTKEVEPFEAQSPRVTPPTGPQQTQVSNTPESQHLADKSGYKTTFDDQGQEPQFRAGMPAPLPPGLDLSDEDLREGDLPGNLLT